MLHAFVFSPVTKKKKDTIVAIGYMEAATSGAHLTACIPQQTYVCVFPAMHAMEAVRV